MEIGENLSVVLIIAIFVGCLVVGGVMETRDNGILEREQEKTRQLEIQWKLDSIQSVESIPMTHR